MMYFLADFGKGVVHASPSDRRICDIDFGAAWWWVEADSPDDAVEIVRNSLMPPEKQHATGNLGRIVKRSEVQP